MNKDFFKNLWDRLKKIKGIKIILIAAAIAIVIALYFASLSPQNTSLDIVSPQSTTKFSSSSEYVDYMENKLESVLSNVKGAGKVNVIITLSSGFEYTYAVEEEVRQTSSGTITTTKLVLVDGQPVITDIKYPSIKGIVVVAKGAQDVKVKMDILTAIQTIVDDSQTQIQILESQ